ncbi:hypothetical protein ACTFIU_010307 [Dictyostelium citrinum]
MNKIDISLYNDNSILFFKIWRNCVLKKIIFKHLMMFNLFSFSVDLKFLQHHHNHPQQTQQFIQDNKQYIKSLIIRVDEPNLVIEGLNNLQNDIVSIRIVNQTDSIECDLPNLISTTLPKSIKILKITEKFNEPLSSLAIRTKAKAKTNNNNINRMTIFSNLTILELGFYFNQLIDVNILPKSLKVLKLGYYFNQIINENVLPKSLEKIVFQNKFNQSLKYLPQSIKVIKFSYQSNFDQKINELPTSLTKLSLPAKYDMTLIKDSVLPNSLLKLKITNISRYCHVTQKYLKLKAINRNGNFSIDQEITNLLDVNISKIIPSSVTNLSIFYYNSCTLLTKFNKTKSLSSQFSIVKLNITTSYFSFYSIYKESSLKLLDKFQGIKSLRVNLIENNFKLDNHSKSCLSNLINLDLNDFNYMFYTKPVKDFKVFSQLKCLRIGDYNSTITSNTLPPSLELLELGNKFKIQSIHKKWLPASIKHIIVLNDQTPISINSLPDSLESIWITDNHYQLKDFKFFTSLLSKLNIVDQYLILKIFNKIFKKKYKHYLY